MFRTITIFLALLLAIPSVALANCGACGVGGERHTQSGEIVNSECPVMGGGVGKDTPYTAEYKGKKIGFCCAGCVDAFKKNPEKYIGKIKALKEEE